MTPLAAPPATNPEPGLLPAEFSWWRFVAALIVALAGTGYILALCGEKIIVVIYLFYGGMVLGVAITLLAIVLRLFRVLGKVLAVLSRVWASTSTRECFISSVLVAIAAVAGIWNIANECAFIDGVPARLGLYEISAAGWLSFVLFVFLATRLAYLLLNILCPQAQHRAAGTRWHMVCFGTCLAVIMLVNFPGTTNYWFSNRFVDVPLPTSAVLLERQWYDGRWQIENKLWYAGHFVVSPADAEKMLTQRPWWTTDTFDRATVEKEMPDYYCASPAQDWREGTLADTELAVISWVRSGTRHYGLSPIADPDSSVRYGIAYRSFGEQGGLGSSWRRLLIVDRASGNLYYYRHYDERW